MVGEKGTITSWKMEIGNDGSVIASSAKADERFKLALLRNFEFKLPLDCLLNESLGAPSTEAQRAATIAASKLRLRFSLWQNRLPVDALPPEGGIELQLLSEAEMDVYGS